MDGIVNQGFVDVDRKIGKYNLEIPIPVELLELNKDGDKADEAKTQERKDSLETEHVNCNQWKNNPIQNFCSRHRKNFRYLTWFIVNGLVIAYLTFATLYWRQNNTTTCNYEWCDGYGMLIILAVLIYGTLFYYHILKRFLWKPISSRLSLISEHVSNLKESMNVCCSLETICLIFISVPLLLFIIVDSIHSTERLTSLIGVIVLTVITWIFSKHPTKVNWRPVISGFLLQLIFGLIVIRWAVGRAILKCISDKVAFFLDFSKRGSRFVFSDVLVDETNVFAFSSLPVIFFMSFIVQILYYLGIMQWVISKLGWALQKAMGTTVCESMNASANVFLGMTESPLLIKPYISSLTVSEIHAVMCCGFATVSGTVMAAYISFGAEPAHLISSSIMSAPAALCFSKLFYPETEKTLTSYENIKLEKSPDTGVLDAATKGALAAIPLILGIVANIIAFVSFVEFCDSILEWSAGLLGHDGVNLQVIMAKICMPLSWIMGIPWRDCDKVGTLIGIKTVVNEFVAYKQLGEFKKQGVLSPRSQAIATYAICGFSNPASVGILIGGLTNMAPEKSREITGVAMRSFVAGSFVCFLTACIAGVLITDDFHENIVNATMTV